MGHDSYPNAGDFPSPGGKELDCRQNTYMSERAGYSIFIEKRCMCMKSHLLAGGPYSNKKTSASGWPHLKKEPSAGSRPIKIVLIGEMHPLHMYVYGKHRLDLGFSKRKNMLTPAKCFVRTENPLLRGHRSTR